MCGEITLFLNCVVPENIHSPTPLPPPLPTEDRNSKGSGGPKGGNFRGVGGLLCLLTVAYRGFLTCHPSPVTRHPSPATSHPPPANSPPSPVTRHPPPATRGKVLPITQVRTYIKYILCNRRRTLFNITTMAGSFCVPACFSVTLSQFVPREMQGWI